MVTPNRLKNIIIGKSLQAKREILDYSRSDIAERLAIKPQFVANWERGQCLPPKNVLSKLMELYDMDKKDFVNLYTMATKEGLKEYFDSLEG